MVGGARLLIKNFGLEQCAPDVGLGTATDTNFNRVWELYYPVKAGFLNWKI